MKKYVVKPGDSLGVIALQHQTTLRILMDDNPIIPDNQALEPGWVLDIYTPVENAQRFSRSATEQVEGAARLKDEIATSDHLLSTRHKPVTYKERAVLEGQMAFIRTKTETPIFEVQANGYQKVIRSLPAGEILRVYDIAEIKGEPFYLVDGYAWVTTNTEKVEYDPIPQYQLDRKIRLNTKPDTSAKKVSASSVSAAAVSPMATIGYGPKQSADRYKVKPSSMIGAGPSPSGGSAGKLSMPHFERPNYKRPVMHMKTADGETTTIELRVLGFNANYSNTVTPAATNGGWMVNIGAHNMPRLTISGFLMETEAANEFDLFMHRYHKYLAAKRTNDYYSLGVSTLYYKQTEYQGIVTAFQYNDREAETYHRKYTMQMLVLKEKILSKAGVKKIPTVVSRRGLSEEDFRSDLGAMLANPITGKYHTDFY